ncbi:MAG TPA: hypothetical protein PK007_00150 [Candidatus Kapabacteria bacterium]|nr:hypothetical protein [Candidatus Kapabacteria bacterium]HPP40122.1 hypothetical protein [Candidatus Kapabacteria bacterium]
MFFGSTPKVIGDYLYQEFQRLNPKRVFNPFAGAFAIEQIVSKACPSAKILSSDVSLFSSALGFYFANKPNTISIKDTAIELVPFLKDKTDSESVAAAVLVFSDLAAYIENAEKIDYYQKVANHIINNFETYFNKAVEKLRKIKGAIHNLDYYAMDAVELLKQVEPGDVVYLDPPYFQGGYEKMFKNLPNYFDFKEPKYTCIDKEKVVEYLKTLDKCGITAYYKCLNTDDELPKNYKLSMVFQHKYHACHCIYTNAAEPTMFVKRYDALKETVKKYKIANEDLTINQNTKIQIVRVDNDVANHYRMLWIKKAEIKQANYSFLVLADKQIIGVICINSINAVKRAFGSDFKTDKAIIISDAASPMTKYKRLSKLILHLILTKDFLYQINELTLWEYTGFTTAAYTNNPVSMKYRGLFELVKREELKEGNYKFKLIYHSKKMFNSIAEARDEWIKKYAGD